MGLEQVIDEVRTNAEKQAQNIVNAARTEGAQIVADAKAKAADYEAKKLAQAESDAEQLKGQTISHAEFESRKARLEAESELRSSLKGLILEGLAALDEGTRKKHIDALMSTARKEIKGGSIWCAEADKDLLGTGYSFAGPAQIAGGIIVESKDGKIRLDLSYENLLDDQWRTVLQAEAGLFA